MVKVICERNGYPDNNFTEEEYMAYIKEYKEKLFDIANNLENMGEKQIRINEHGDYNSILAAEDEEDLFHRDALLSAAKNLVYICNLIQKR